MSNLSLWSARSPFAEFDELVHRAFGPSAQAWPAAAASTRATGFRPAAEVGRDGDDAVVRVEVPGLDVEKDVMVEVTGGRLVVRGERRDERASEAGTTGARFREVRYGRFERSWTLPEHVGPEAVTAGYDAGVLTLRVAGVHAEAPGHRTHRIPVTASNPAAEAPAAPAVEEHGEAHSAPESEPAGE